MKNEAAGRRQGDALMLEILTMYPTAVVAACALVVSICSLLVATRALKQQREHNYRSVRPIAHLARGDYEDCLYVTLKNYGSGPLLIESFFVESRESTHRRIIDALGSLAEQHIWDDFTDTLDGRALAPKEEFVLLKGSFDEQQQRVRTAVRASLAQMSITVKYCDVYGRPQPVLAEKLSWFART